MSSFTSKLKTAWHRGLQKISDADYITPAEQAVKRATYNSDEIVSNSQKDMVAEYTKNHWDLGMVLYVTRNRLQANKRNWRVIQKTLQLVEYCLIHGSYDFALYCRNEEMKKYIRRLTIFSHTNKEGTDRGKRIRTLSERVLKLVEDSELLGKERAVALVNRMKLEEKIGGISHNDIEIDESQPYGASYKMDMMVNDKEEEDKESLDLEQKWEDIRNELDGNDLSGIFEDVERRREIGDEAFKKEQKAKRKQEKRRRKKSKDVRTKYDTKYDPEDRVSEPTAEEKAWQQAEWDAFPASDQEDDADSPPQEEDLLGLGTSVPDGPTPDFDATDPAWREQPSARRRIHDVPEFATPQPTPSDELDPFAHPFADPSN